MLKLRKTKNVSLVSWIVIVSLILIYCHRAKRGFNTIDLQNIAEERTYTEGVLTDSDIVAINGFILQDSSYDYNFYMFNKFRSDQLTAFRSLPDTRAAFCSQRLYRLPKEDLKVSVIIVYHNEARSTLVRTLLSIMACSPSRYLAEIVLLDDYSQDDQLLNQLSTLEFVNRTLVPIRMQRNVRRLGVIASRNLGANLASGHYLLFLDSHCEVNVGWLEPLLERMADSSDDKLAVSPGLDSIDASTFEYRGSLKNLKGGFDWSLHFHWIPFNPDEVEKNKEMDGKSLEENTHAFNSPVFSGGIFMISRNWFFKLNGFNPLLEIWGGESIEMSIKTWLCGGQIEIVPCSRVGHVFRTEHPFDFPHEDDGQLTYLRNSKVIAESWLDEYKYFFYASKPAARNISLSIPHGAQDKLKLDLQCRSFAWYRQSVFKELKIPSDEFAAYGQLSNFDTRCLQITANATRIYLHMTSCYDHNVMEWRLKRSSGQLQSSAGVRCLNVVYEELSSNKAVVYFKPNFSVIVENCKKSDSAQRWLRRDGRLIHAATRLCLDNPLQDVVMVSRCRRVAPTQLFRFSMEMQWH